MVNNGVVVGRRTSTMIIAVTRRMTTRDALSTAALDLCRVRVAFLRNGVLLPCLQVRIFALNRGLEGGKVGLGLFRFIFLFGILSFRLGGEAKKADSKVTEGLLRNVGREDGVSRS